MSRPAIAVSVGVLLTQVACSERVQHRSEIREVDAAVAEIEAFRKREGRLPAIGEVLRSARECDMECGGVCMFYEAACGSYVVGYSVGLDEKYYFDSLHACWSFECDARPVPLKGYLAPPCLP